MTDDTRDTERVDAEVERADAANHPNASTDGGYETGLGLQQTEDVALRGPRQALVVAATEYRLAVRNRWAIALTVVFTAFALGLTTFSGSAVSPAGYERIVASLAVLAIYLVPLVALAFSYDAIVGREESGWLQALFAMPISRGWLVAGTYLGRAVVLATATVVGFGIAGALLLREYGIAGFQDYVGFLLATVVLGLVFLAIGVAVSTLAREKTHALGFALLAWAWFVLVHDLLALGFVAAFSLSEAAVSAMLLANPASVYRALVLGGLGAGGDAGFAAAFAAAGLSPGVLVATLAAWTLLPLAVAGIAIRRRRL